MTDDKMVLTANEVADMLRVSYSTVVALANKGDIPAFRVGGMWRFHREAINELIERGRG